MDTILWILFYGYYGTILVVDTRILWTLGYYGYYDTILWILGYYSMDTMDIKILLILYYGY